MSQRNCTARGATAKESWSRQSQLWIFLLIWHFVHEHQHNWCVVFVAESSQRQKCPAECAMQCAQRKACRNIFTLWTDRNESATPAWSCRGSSRPYLQTPDPGVKKMKFVHVQTEFPGWCSSACRKKVAWKTFSFSPFFWTASFRPKYLGKNRLKVISVFCRKITRLDWKKFLLKEAIFGWNRLLLSLSVHLQLQSAFPHGAVLSYLFTANIPEHDGNPETVAFSKLHYLHTVPFMCAVYETQVTSEINQRASSNLLVDIILLISWRQNLE